MATIGNFEGVGGQISFTHFSPESRSLDLLTVPDRRTDFLEILKKCQDPLEVVVTSRKVA